MTRDGKDAQSLPGMAGTGRIFESETLLPALEPFRVKAVESIRPFQSFPARCGRVLIDLLTESGTAAMGARQWGALLEGDECYAGSSSFNDFTQPSTKSLEHFAGAPGPCRGAAHDQRTVRAG